MCWLPDLSACTVCTASVIESGAWFHPSADGLRCRQHAMPASAWLLPETLQLAQRMLRCPVAEFAAQPWSAQRAADLRRFAIQALERHLERRLRTAEALRRLSTSVSTVSPSRERLS
jgi:DNA repair protein RecO (recombination protein O)